MLLDVFKHVKTSKQHPFETPGWCFLLVCFFFRYIIYTYGSSKSSEIARDLGGYEVYAAVKGFQGTLSESYSNIMFQGFKM